MTHGTFNAHPRSRQVDQPSAADSGAGTRSTPARPARTSGAAAVLGGALWVACVVVHSLRPRGCVAAECAIRPMRDSGALEAGLALCAALLLMAALAGLLRHTRRTHALGRHGETGVRVGGAGLGLLLAAGITQSVVGPSFRWMPYLVAPGMLAVAMGFLLVGVALLRARVVPGWVGALLVLGSVATLGSNEQTSLVLLLVPVGVAWMAVGYALWSRGTAD
jgi:hypothetical protein